MQCRCPRKLYKRLGGNVQGVTDQRGPARKNRLYILEQPIRSIVGIDRYTERTLDNEALFAQCANNIGMKVRFSNGKRRCGERAFPVDGPAAGFIGESGRLV